ncbi:hypothetical protein LUZ60_017636 [Juncus effusus]|nr:hypothetical protein LUZ60_017636 [Juncus effusus]
MTESIVATALARLNCLAEDGTPKDPLFSRDMPKKLDSIKNDLSLIQCSLKDAESKSSEGDETAKMWLKEVRNVSYLIEDLADNMKQVEAGGKRKSEGSFLKKFVDKPGEMLALREITTLANDIMSKLKELSESGKRYDSEPLSEKQDEERSIRDSHHFEDQINIVGFDHHLKHIKNLLIDHEKKDRSVISLVGMGGLGKTTLAKNVYDNLEVRENFQVFGWIVVSQGYTTVNLLKNVLKELLGLNEKSYNSTTEITIEQLEKMQEKELIETIRDLLQKKKYFVVLDGIWNVEAWGKIQQVFPNTENGSRILLTTRSFDVVKPTDPFSHTIELQFLNEEDSWELLKNKIFQTIPSDKSIIHKLEPIGQTLAKKCQGLPLSLVMLSGLLSKDINQSSWSKIAERMDSESLSCGNRCLDILAQNYNQLPNSHVKSCFLYISSFPDNSLISTSKLFKLWIAEGFIPQSSKLTFEQTAEEYLNVLIESRLVQVAVRTGTASRVKKVRIHEVLRGWCIEEALKNNFFDIIKNSSETTPTVYESNHAFIYNKSFDNALFECLQNPRAIVGSGLIIEELKQQNYGQLNLLRVFDLESSHFNNWSKLEDAILKMRHLRFLGLSHANIFGDASFTRNLFQLQTFDVRGPFLTNLFPELWNIQTLRNVYLSGNIVPTVTPNVTTSLHKLHLELHTPSTYDWKPVQELLSKQQKLAFLTIKVKASFSPSGTIPVENFQSFKNHEYLHCLKLEGRLVPSKLPSTKDLPLNLTELILIKSHLKKDPMPMLERLPNLMLLRLEYGAYKGHTGMCCSSGGFPKLQYLKIDGSCNLKGWKVEEGAMPLLAQLHIRVYDFMERLPEALSNMNHLKELHLTVYEEDSDWLATRMHKQKGEDWGKIKHVPYIGVHMLPNLFFTEKPNRTFSATNAFIRHLAS